MEESHNSTAASNAPIGDVPQRTNSKAPEVTAPVHSLPAVGESTMDDAERVKQEQQTLPITTKYEKLQRRLLNSPLIAIVVLLAVVVGFLVKEVSDSLDLLGKFHGPVVSVKASSLQYETAPSTTLTIPLSITLISAPSDHLQNVSIALSAEQQGNDGAYAPIGQGQLNGYFLLDPESIDVGPLDLKSGSAMHDLRMRFDVSGRFRLHVSVRNGKKELGFCSVLITVLDKELSGEITHADKDNPIILVKQEGVVEPWPQDYRRFDRFRLLFLSEHNELNDSDRAMLWMSSYYVGSCPMNCFLASVRLNGVGLIDYLGEPPPAKGPMGLSIMDSGTPIRVPLGTKIYQLQRLDDFRLMVKDVTAASCAAVTGSVDDDDPTDQKPHNWTFPSLNLRFSETLDCGASGRICDDTIVIRHKSFESIQSMDESQESTSAFPLFFDLGPTSVNMLTLKDGVHVSHCSLRATQE